MIRTMNILEFVLGDTQTSVLLSALLMIVLESWVNAHARPESRSRFMGLYMINYYVAGAAGQLLVGVNEPTDPRSFSLVAGLMVAAMIPLCLTSRPAPAPPSRKS